MYSRFQKTMMYQSKYYETPNGHHVLCSRDSIHRYWKIFHVEIKGTNGSLLKWIDKKDTLMNDLDEIVDDKLVANALDRVCGTNE